MAWKGVRCVLMRRMFVKGNCPKSREQKKKETVVPVTGEHICSGQQGQSITVSARDALNGVAAPISLQSETSQHEGYCLNNITMICENCGNEIRENRKHEHKNDGQECI